MSTLASPPHRSPMSSLVASSSTALFPSANTKPLQPTIHHPPQRFVHRLRNGQVRSLVDLICRPLVIFFSFLCNPVSRPTQSHNQILPRPPMATNSSQGLPSTVGGLSLICHPLFKKRQPNDPPPRSNPIATGRLAPPSTNSPQRSAANLAELIPF